MEIIDKGIDPQDPSKNILEVNMTEQEAAQMELLAAQTGRSVEDLVVDILQKAVNEPKDFAEQCAFMSFMDEARKRNEGF